MSHTCFWLTLMFFCPCLLQAQLELPVRLELNGADAVDRQVIGLADPIRSDAAMNLDAARAQLANTTTTTGSDPMVGQLHPAPTSLTPGMVLTIIPQESNAAGARLALNDHGPYPLVKWGGIAVDSADLPTGSPCRMIFDGTRFQVLTNVARPCPMGSFAASALQCIDSTFQPMSTFYEAVVGCADRGGRLCTQGEWGGACLRSAGFLGTVVSAEWIDDAANNTNDAKTVGAGSNGPGPVSGTSCYYGHTRDPNLLARYRCCYDR